MKITCAQITQTFGSPKAAFEAAESFIRASDADMVIFGGDLYDGSVFAVNEVAGILKNIKTKKGVQNHGKRII